MADEETFDPNDYSEGDIFAFGPTYWLAVDKSGGYLRAMSNVPVSMIQYATATDVFNYSESNACQVAEAYVDNFSSEDKGYLTRNTKTKCLVSVASMDEIKSFGYFSDAPTRRFSEHIEYWLRPDDDADCTWCVDQNGNFSDQHFPTDFLAFRPYIIFPL